MAEKNITVTGLLEEIVDDLCNHYCKWYEKYHSFEDEDKLYEQCDKCPLNKI